MLISDLYQTNITCSNYNPEIDAGDGTTTITVTVKLVDFNGNPVTGKSVNLNVDKGYFKSVTGTSTLNYNDTTTTEVSATTKNDGIITAIYVPSEWGLCTFSANNTKIQCNVTGFKTFSNARYTIYYDDKMCHMHFDYDYGTTKFSHEINSWTDFSSKIAVPSTPDDLRPISLIVIPTSRSNFYHLIRSDTGNLAWKNKAGADLDDVKQLQFTVSWKRR